MKEIPLTQGRVALVDDADFDSLNRLKWTLLEARNRPYAFNGKHKTWMHRVIMQPPEGMEIDHRNHDGLDNQVPQKGKSSKYKGVSWIKATKRWRATLKCGGKRRFQRYFKNEKDAANAYNDAAIKYFGEFAYVNIVYKKGF